MEQTQVCRGSSVFLFIKCLSCTNVILACTHARPDTHIHRRIPDCAHTEMYKYMQSEQHGVCSQSNGGMGGGSADSMVHHKRRRADNDAQTRTIPRQYAQILVLAVCLTHPLRPCRSHLSYPTYFRACKHGHIIFLLKSHNFSTFFRHVRQCHSAAVARYPRELTSLCVHLFKYTHHAVARGTQIATDINMYSLDACIHTRIDSGLVINEVQSLCRCK
jgi:hypothetical protein